MRQASYSHQSASISTLTTGACCAGLALGIAAAATSPIAPAQNLQEKIVFSAAFEEGDELDLWMMNPDGTEMVNLTESIGGNLTMLEISPDGKRALYLRHIGPNRLDLWTLEFSDATHSFVREFARYESVAVWYDNDSILYRRTDGEPSTGDIHRIGLDGTELGPVMLASCVGQASIDEFRLSPDGSQIILTAQAGSAASTLDVYIGTSNGSNCRAVFEDPGDGNRDEYPLWHPNGKDAYWAHTVSGLNDERAIYVARDAGTAQQQIQMVRDPEYRAAPLAFSPDGLRIVLTSDARSPMEFYTFDLSTGDEVSLITGHRMGSLDWALVDIGGTAPGLELDDPTPGIGGQLNTFTIRNAEPGTHVYLTYGFIRGNQAVPACPGLALDILRPTIGGSGTANVNGVVDITLFVPPGVKGVTTLLQAVERDECTKSELVEYLWP